MQLKSDPLQIHRKSLLANDLGPGGVAQCQGAVTSSSPRFAVLACSVSGAASHFWYRRVTEVSYRSVNAGFPSLMGIFLAFVQSSVNRVPGAWPEDILQL